ncbi:hypothetical protein [Nocardia mexicana]|uniref:IrrE N-terminal-like domain-containing protein n=1 Tax=Nocardia mexicana TaxID=279262 RepID=A0A370HBA4_9NOCA|nr:hypothetical protein [Nocardia mexicana]RDI54198.1 hypothetical protein DFR68_102322 [Nocardia mexicana]
MNRKTRRRSGTGALEEKLATTLASLPIPEPWDRGRFIEGVAELRGRPITVIPAGRLELPELGESPCGLWLLREHDDIIVHEDATSEYHMDQIVCHEIGHMVLGHGQAEPPADGELGDPRYAAVLPDLDPSTVRGVLGRSHYGDDLEREAETFASMLLVAAVSRRQGGDVRRLFFGQR